MIPVSARSRSSRRWLQDGLAFISAFITALAVSRAIFFYVPSVQNALVVGVAAGLVARARTSAALVAFAASALASLLIVPHELAALGGVAHGAALAGIAAGAALVAAGARWATTLRREMRVWASVGVVALLAANLAVTTLALDATPLAPGAQSAAVSLAQVPPAGTALNDNAFYQRVLGLMSGGEGYYAAFRQAYHENARWASDPSSSLSYRLPTLFWFWTALPAKPWSVFVAWVALAAAGIAAAAWLCSMRVPLPFAIPAAAGLASYFLLLGTTNAILATETWSAPLGVIAVALAVASYRRQRWLGWVVAAVAVSLLAALVRELMAYLLVAGLAAAFVSRREQRRARVAAWAVGLLGFFGLYALHAVRVAGALSHQRGAGYYLQGGLRYTYDAFTWASGYLGGPWLLIAFGMLAVLGAAFASSRAERVLLSIAAVAPVASFLVIGTGAVSDTGVPVNYWAPIVVPVLIALAPWAAAAVPGVTVISETPRAARERI